MSYTLEELRTLVSREARIESKKLPKILIFDIETSPMIAYVWKRFKENISLDQTIQESYMLCWSAKWMFSEKVFGSCVTPEEAKRADDTRVVTDLYNTIRKADIIVAYNGKTFDIPYMNQRFFVLGLKPYEPVYVVDPYETVKNNFRFSSNKMDNIATQLGLQNKIGTDFNLWKGCVEGSQDSLDEMFKYNTQDVVVLEEIYQTILPWIKNHPNIASLSEEKNICSHCGSSNISKVKDRFYTTPSGAKYELFRCKDCGAIFRGRKAVEKGKNLYNNNIR